MFTSASIAQSPKKGRLEQTGNFDFRYGPNKGYSGKDTYAVKICGSGLNGSGCSTIIYTAIIK